MIRKYKLNIPFYVGVIDLMEPPSVWRDKKADITFVPTQDIREDYLSRGFDKDKVLVSGFPVRDDIIERNKAKKVEKPIRILMVNTSTELKTNLEFLKEVMRFEDVTIDFICGLDEPLYKTLETLKEEGKLKDNVKIYGFVNNMNDFLNNAHIILTKAGPNVIVESIHSDTAIVVTGHIHGQEDDNYRYVVDHGFGIKCEDPSRIYDELNKLISSGKLDQCLENMAKYEIDNGAEFIAEYAKKHI
jgi:processive 1,2-diacylglycerol beta-glucosyltransferase